MVQQENRKSYPFDRPGKYRICVQCFLHESWSERLGGMHSSKSEQGDQGIVTNLMGILMDQA